LLKVLANGRCRRGVPLADVRDDLAGVDLRRAGEEETAMAYAVFRPEFG
jgi:hypothetical protein